MTTKTTIIRESEKDLKEKEPRKSDPDVTVIKSFLLDHEPLPEELRDGQSEYQIRVDRVDDNGNSVHIPETRFNKIETLEFELAKKKGSGCYNLWIELKKPDGQKKFLKIFDHRIEAENGEMEEPVNTVLIKEKEEESKYIDLFLKQQSDLLQQQVDREKNTMNLLVTLLKENRGAGVPAETQSNSIKTTREIIEIAEYLNELRPSGDGSPKNMADVVAPWMPQIFKIGEKLIDRKSSINGSDIRKKIELLTAHPKAQPIIQEALNKLMEIEEVKPLIADLLNTKFETPAPETPAAP